MKFLNLLLAASLIGCTTTATPKPCGSVASTTITAKAHPSNGRSPEDFGVARRGPDPDKKVVHKMGGWKSNPHHARDIGRQIVHAPGFRLVPLPAAGTVRQWFYKTNQEDLGACTAFTGMECTDAVYFKLGGQWVHPSALDLYQQELCFDGNCGRDAGSFTSTILAVLTKSAICPDSEWPYIAGNLGTNPPACAVAARIYTALVAYDVPNDDNGYSIKNCIANLQIPVMTGGAWPANWMDTPTYDLATKRYCLKPALDGFSPGGHEVSIISYDDNMVVNGVKGWAEIHNHWVNQDGNPWGDAIGSAWVPQADLFNPHRFEDNGAVQQVKLPAQPAATLRR